MTRTNAVFIAAGACLWGAVLPACGPSSRRAAQAALEGRASILPEGAATESFAPRAVGDPPGVNERPQISHVAIADLDGDGLRDILACDAGRNRVSWIRQAPGRRIHGARARGRHPGAGARRGGRSRRGRRPGSGGGESGAALSQQPADRRCRRTRERRRSAVHEPCGSRRASARGRRAGGATWTATATRTWPLPPSATTTVRSSGWRTGVAGLSSLTCCCGCPEPINAVIVDIDSR